MKRFRTAVLIFLCLCTLSLYACTGTPGTQNTKDGKPLCDGNTLKILAITSSAGLNTTELLGDIALAEGCTNVIVGRLYASGCSLIQHISNAQNNTKFYEYTKFTNGTWASATKNTSMQEGLKDEDWDIIFIQQGAAQAPLAYTYHMNGKSYVNTLIKLIRDQIQRSDVPFVWNMTWAFQSDSTQPVFVDNFKKDQMAMYNSILNAVKEQIVPINEIHAIIPSGTAIQNARTSFIGDTLTKDTYHLNNLGRVIAGYTLYSILTEKEITAVNVDVVSSFDISGYHVLTDEEKQVIVEAVNAAIAKPYEITPSKFIEQ